MLVPRVVVVVIGGVVGVPGRRIGRIIARLGLDAARVIPAGLIIISRLVILLLLLSAVVLRIYLSRLCVVKRICSSGSSVPVAVHGLAGHWLVLPDHQFRAVDARVLGRECRHRAVVVFLDITLATESFHQMCREPHFIEVDCTKEREEQETSCEYLYDKDAEYSVIRRCTDTLVHCVVVYTVDVRTLDVIFDLVQIHVRLAQLR